MRPSQDDHAAWIAVDGLSRQRPGPPGGDHFGKHGPPGSCETPGWGVGACLGSLRIFYGPALPPRKPNNYNNARL